ncbi:MAG TPA: glycosyltransferase family 4 protein [Candidatus Limnocylindrales bacterium]|nr:glycosyltransferase family 4 protein [Candidatus Limnocylindrales bacterium]
MIDTFDVGGFELACLELLSRLDPARFSSSIHTFRPGGLVEPARSAGIQVTVGHDKPSTDRRWRAADARARLRWTDQLATEMAAVKADLCFVWGWPEAINAAQAAGVPAIVERVDGPALSARVPDKSACTRVVVESDLVRRILLAQRRRFGVDARRVVVVRNGVDLERFDAQGSDRGAARSAYGIPPEAFVVGTLARLSAEKNLGQLIDGFAAALGDSPPLAQRGWLVIAGPDGGSRAALERQAQRSAARDRIVFSGPVEDRAALLGALDVYCTTSYTEGTPAAVLEAMAMGLPIVATPVGALLEMLDGNALIVDVMAPRETALAIAQLAADARLRGRLGARSLALSKGWSMEAHVARYEQVLESAYAEAAAGRA